MTSFMKILYKFCEICQFHYVAQRAIISTTGLIPESSRKEVCVIPAKIRQAKWQNDYISRAYDRLNILIPSGQKPLVKAAADEAEESVNEYTNKALLQRMGLEEWPKGE